MLVEAIISAGLWFSVIVVILGVFVVLIGISLWADERVEGLGCLIWIAIAIFVGLVIGFYIKSDIKSNAVEKAKETQVQNEGQIRHG